jgi:hypothetical protein
VSGQGESKVGERAALFAVNSVLSIPRFGGSNLLVPREETNC